MQRSLLTSLLTLSLAPAQLALAESSEAENPSNPLSKSRNTDVRWQYLSLESGDHINDYFIDGAFMANDKLKIKYELHYWETNTTGKHASGWESMTLKAIYFGQDGQWGETGYRMAAGLDWIIDFGDQSKGIGSGSDQLAPFLGISMNLPSNTSLIPLVQHFTSYSGDDVNTTAFRLIALQPLPQKMWAKLDAKLPIEWDNNQHMPATAELQLGRHVSEKAAVYCDLLVGLGSDRPYDWGGGIGIRFKY